MTDKYRHNAPNASIPIYQIDEAIVNDAYAAYSALRRAAQYDPGLLENEYFTALQDTAYARFIRAFEVLR